MTIKDLDKLLGPVRHHAKEAAPQVEELFMYLNAAGFTPHTSRGGPNSWSITTEDGREYHFRGSGHGDPTIRVYDRYQKGTLIATLKTPAQCRRFVKSI
jgi:hypothetical protein